MVERIPPPIEHNSRWWQREIAQAEVVVSVSVGDEQEPPKPVCDAEVLGHKPARAFDVIGLVEVEQRGAAWREESILEAARSEVCRLGGDALVILYSEDVRRAPIDPRIPDAGRVLRRPLFRGAILRYR